MKNGFTPREYAHALAIDALSNAYHNSLGELDELSPAEQEAARNAILRLHDSLADKAKLDTALFR